jgi:hypothetical protein
MANSDTPLVTSASSTTGRFAVTCPWCGTVNMIAMPGVQLLPGCGHVVDVWKPESRRYNGSVHDQQRLALVSLRSRGQYGRAQGARSRSGGAAPPTAGASAAKQR